MKNKLFTLALALSCFYGKAQISINSNHIASIGDVRIFESDTLPPQIFPSTGENQYWNYNSILTTHTYDTLSFVSPNSLSNYSSFTNSNLAIQSHDGVEIYLNNNSSNLSVVGMATDVFGTGTDQKIIYNPASEIISFPMTFGNLSSSFSNQSITLIGVDLGMPFDSLVTKTYESKFSEAVGWGKLLTPYGLFDVILIENITTQIDSSWMYESGVETFMYDGFAMNFDYSFWSDDIYTGFPLMQINHDGNEITEISWIQTPNELLGVENSFNEEVQITRTGNSININNLPSSSCIQIIDISGKLVYNLSSHEINENIEISSFEKGIYLIRVLDQKTATITTKKISI